MVQIPGGDLGAIVTFRYLSPKAHDASPLVMLLTRQHSDGYMHGMNLRYLTPMQQQQLQHYFYPPGNVQHDHSSPWQQEEMQDYLQQVAAAEQQEEEDSQVEGFVMKANSDSPFGGMGTFTRTAGALVQRARGAVGMLRKYIPFGGRQKPPPVPPPPVQQSPFAGMNRTSAPQINNPMAFYYNFVKPVLGSDTKNAYRKYNPAYIQRLQIVHTPPQQYTPPTPGRLFPRLFGRKKEE